LNKVVIACVTGDDLSAIAEMSRRHDVEVIAVALDLGEGPSLRELHDLARAAGASRCHVLGTASARLEIFDGRISLQQDCATP
jgi:argininosuccinate synthase